MIESSKKPNLDGLVRKASRGDEKAFSELYELYFEKIYRFVFFRVNHREAAQDLTSETFMKAWGRLAEIEAARAFTAWLYQIARNLVIDYYRTRKQDVDLNTLENTLQYEDNIVQKANLSFDQKNFLLALKKLTADQQLVIKLKFLDELDNNEIAALLYKSEGAVRVIQHRAINELKRILNDHDA